MLEVKSLRAGYGEVTVLHDVSIEVGEGSIVSIVGANGAGKSTLINAISGLVRPTGGSIVYEGVDLLSVPNYDVVRRGVVQVPEGRKLFASMTVYENLMLGATHPRARDDKELTLRQVFELFPRLQERRKQMAGTLSGGEQQMLAIGRALMSKPRLLMLDEPSLGLAPRLVADVFRVIERLNSIGLTVLLVEQNIRHCLGISSYAYVLENGQVVLEGTGKELLSNPYTKQAYLGM